MRKSSTNKKIVLENNDIVSTEKKKNEHADSTPCSQNNNDNDEKGRRCNDRYIMVTTVKQNEKDQIAIMAPRSETRRPPITVAVAVAAAASHHNGPDDHGGNNDANQDADNALLQGYEGVIPNNNNGKIGNDNAACPVAMPSTGLLKGISDGNHHRNHHQACKKNGYFNWVAAAKSRQHSSAACAPSSTNSASALYREDKNKVQNANHQIPQKSPREHIYALREIITTCSTNRTTPTSLPEEDSLLSSKSRNEEDEDKVEDGKQKEDEKRNKDTNYCPRIIASQVLRVTESIYNMLENTTAGTVLLVCPSSSPAWTTPEDESIYYQRRKAARDDGNSTAESLYLQHFHASSWTLSAYYSYIEMPHDVTYEYDHVDGTTKKKKQSSLFIVAVSASSIQKQIMKVVNSTIAQQERSIAILNGEGSHHVSIGSRHWTRLNYNDNRTAGEKNMIDGQQQYNAHPSRKQTKKKLMRLPGMKLFGSIKRLRSRKKKKNSSKNDEASAGYLLLNNKENIIPSTALSATAMTTTRQYPKMTIQNGIIDWENSHLDNSCCQVIPRACTSVAYYTTTTTSSGGCGGCVSSTTAVSRLINNKNGDKKATTIAIMTNTTPVIPSLSLGSTIFGDDAVIHNSIQPINEIVCINQPLGIYISESGLSASDCQNIINVSEFCALSKGGWSSYTYAKQTLGCRENDQLAFVSARPVMTACATIRKHLMSFGEDEETATNATSNTTTTDGCNNNNNAEGELKISSASHHKFDDEARNKIYSNGVIDTSSSRPTTPPRRKKKELVLDIREPHVVKYDTSKMERQKLDMHTDKSEWTFLIALSEGRGQDYGGGGTYFQALNSTVHLQRSQMLIFRGRLRHCGVAIQSGCRYLLVGFLVPHVKTTT